jgi:hypothetical protein|tara:strand:+ start:1473 stop:1733 length:261 start_codon:yes stop_codon:yes gene_type:complete
MSKLLNIGANLISLTQFGVNEYKLSIFQNKKFVQNFNMSLQPNNSDEILPTFQLVNKQEVLPKSIKDNLNNISDWIIEIEKAHNNG